jgi:Uma2 family endonuclease
MAIEVEIPRRRFTVDEYHRMAEAGIFQPDERVELIDGEIVQMAAISPRHAGCVININRLFVTRLRERAVVSPQTPEDVLLAVEVADTTVRFDRLVKARLYARAMMAEFWLLLASDGSVEIYREPGPDGYASVTAHGTGQRVSPLAFPEMSFAVDDFFA